MTLNTKCLSSFIKSVYRKIPSPLTTPLNLKFIVFKLKKQKKSPNVSFLSKRPFNKYVFFYEQPNLLAAGTNSNAYLPPNASILFKIRKNNIQLLPLPEQTVFLRAITTVFLEVLNAQHVSGQAKTSHFII